MISQITSYNSIQRGEPEDEINLWPALFSLFILAMGAAFLLFLDRKKSLSPKTETERKIERMGFVEAPFPGKSRIFIHRDRPGELIKYSPIASTFRLKDRLKQMEACRTFCRANGFRLLVVPEGRIEDDYLRERRLPISEVSQIGQIGLYLSNSERFNGAVAEFVKFLCLAEFDDLLGSSELSSFSEVVNARYDNASLYLEGGEGKIGLVDLESFSLMDAPPSLEHIKSACVTSVTFFPLHFDLILSVAESFDPHIRGEREALEEVRLKVVELFERSWIAHQRFFTLHGITPSNPTERVGMSRAIQLEIIDSLIHSSEWTFGEREAALLPSILDRVERFNQKRFDTSVVKKYRGGELSPYQLSSMRAVFIDREEIPWSCLGEYDQGEKGLNRAIAEELSSHGGSPLGFVRWVSDSIYFLLVEKGVIAGFRPRVYGGRDLVLF